MSGNLLAGTAHVTVGGLTIMVAGKFKYRPSKMKRTTLNGMDGVHGYKEEYIPGQISCDVRDSGGTVVADFNNQTNVNVVAKLANGKTIIGSGLWTVDTQDVNSEDATFPVTWEGRVVTEN
ncbi:phage tail tube protein [Pantoea agglomerans pv. betae]|uniref:phage tail tube protein n=1 Tax=Enterobacter agglomerans TaxID=549 RepID=UPI0007E5B551|nr:phage tail tube protein [Pantoea agglomerans]WHU82979.1 phage tail tube protein [Pantoea agglomerans pv. betae]